MGRYSLGIDIGGTFTDLVLLAEGGTVWTEKILSTPEDYSVGIMEGIQSLLHKQSLRTDQIERVVHASTIATNIILEGKGARTALVTTRGYKDILEMRRLRIPVLYDLQYRKPRPLVPRSLSFEVTERVDASGNVIAELREEELSDVASKLTESEAEAVAVCFLHSYANPENELAVEEYLRRKLPADVFVCRSSDILPKLREYERCSTTVVNAYIGPKVQQYLDHLASRLDKAGIACPIKIMHSGGGIMSLGMARKMPVYLVESGPAAGVTGCAEFSAMAGYGNVISFDMGGTTTKAAIVEGGLPAKTDEYEVGSGVSISSKLVKGGGYPIALPFIDVSEIGAGGGSLIYLSNDRQINVGPDSAGASPGPMCYGAGGATPALTDALVVLGYINPHYLAGGSIQLDAKLALDGFAAQIAQPLGKEPVEAAYGIYKLAVDKMTRAVKGVSTYRGRDPREYTLVAFGGNGPVVAVELAAALNMQKVLIPPASGVFSAVGLLVSRTEHEFVKTVLGVWKSLCDAELEDVFTGLEDEARQWIRDEGIAAGNYRTLRFAEIRYSGQAYDLVIPVAGAFEITKVRETFDRVHLETYGHKSPIDPIELVTLKVLVQDTRPVEMASVRVSETDSPPGDTERRVYFGSEHGYLSTPILPRADLADTPRSGPMIVEDYDSTCVVPPGWQASLDEKSNIHIDCVG